MKHYQISIYLNTTGEGNVDEAVKDACNMFDDVAGFEVEDVHYEEVDHEPVDEEPPFDK